MSEVSAGVGIQQIEAQGMGREGVPVLQLDGDSPTQASWKKVICIAKYYFDV